MTESEEAAAWVGCAVLLLGSYLIIHNAGWGVWFGVLLLHLAFEPSRKPK